MKRSYSLMAGLAVLVLVGAAYLAGRLLSQKAPEAAERPLVVDQGDGVISTSGKYPHTIERAAELPQAPADVSGILLRRQDRSILVGTGNITGVGSQAPDGSTRIEMQTDGPQVEVVLGVGAAVYKDVTVRPDPSAPPATVQQVLEPGSLDELEQNAVVAAWGTRSGDRVTAQVLVYHLP